MTAQGPREELLEVLTETLAARGYDLEDVEVSKAGRRHLVRVLVDTADGVTLDAIADATQVVSELLDSDDVLGDDSYTLEVTSPGVDRPLTAPRHWRRNLGRLVKVTPVEGAAFIGRVQDCDEAAARLATDHGVQEVLYRQVSSARVQVEFNKPRSAASTAGARNGDHTGDRVGDETGDAPKRRSGKKKRNKTRKE